MTSMSARFLRLCAAGALAAAALLPSVTPAAASTLTLRVGTTQDLDAMNPWNTALEVGYEVFTLNYDLLVGFGPSLEPIPGYASSWTRQAAADGKSFTWTFKIRDGMKWSDGQPATAEDARWTLQFVLDAANGGNSIGLGYIDPDLKNAGVTKIAAPDPTTLVITNTDPSNRILQMYIPILPEHVWKGQTLKSIPTFTNDPPVVGTGPYQAVEWKTGQYVRLVRNPYFWGKRGAADEVVLQFFKNPDTMVQALKSGQIDYATGVNAAQFDNLKTVPGMVAVAGTTNGWTELDLNSYGKDIPGGGASTKALRDPAFRDALGYAIDKNLLISKVLGGYGTPGTTQVPPFQTRWHVEPDNPRTFDIGLAKQKLDAAGYILNASGQRLDKQGKPLKLRLYMPNSDATYPKDAQFIKDWFSQLGIEITTQIFDSGTLTTLELPPTKAAPTQTAAWDMIIWGWTGYADPNPLLQIFTTGAIGSTSDSLYSNPTYDQLFTAQNAATTYDQRHQLMAQMQNIFYNDAPYHILYYPSTLDVHRTDKFGGWQNQPANGVPLFGYGSLDYTLLTDANAATPAPSVAVSAGPSASGGPSASPAPVVPGGTSSGSPLPLVAGIAVVAALLVGVLLMTRRRRAATGEDDE
ncbi:MAG: ABC transporter substrate-binding protein [Candidatus Limnocylindrales bacterium]